jgi:hypothetical protein
MIAKFFSEEQYQPFPDMEPAEMKDPLRRPGTWDIFHGIKRVKYSSRAFHNPNFCKVVERELEEGEKLTQSPADLLFSRADYFSGMFLGPKDPPFYMAALLEYENGTSETVVFAGTLYLCNEKGKTVDRISVDDHIVSAPMQPGRGRIVEEEASDIVPIIEELRKFQMENGQA